MPARPIPEETLQLIDAVRAALEGCSDVVEKRMFGCHVFMVNGKLCLGVEGDELLVRLPPATHAAVAETPGVRPLSGTGKMDGYFYISPAAYATRARWQQWIADALAFNPLAKATPTKAATSRAAAEEGGPAPARRSVKKSSSSTTSLRKTAKTPPKTTTLTPDQPAPAPLRRHPVFEDDDDGDDDGDGDDGL